MSARNVASLIASKPLQSGNANKIVVIRREQ
jgi:hypothetical protein